MILWRLSGRQHAQAFDGGYGLWYDGRWNSAGRAVTYCATSPSLCVLEKLVHIQDPDLLPDLMMVRYEVSDGLGVDQVTVGELPQGWRSLENWTQQRGDTWFSALEKPLLQVPSAVVPLTDSPDVNVLINHTHPASSAITIVSVDPFILDPRLF